MGSIDARPFHPRGLGAGMTAAELLRDMRAEHAARVIYGRAVERHFATAERLVKTDPEAAERIAKGAVALRMDARYELRG